MKNCFLFLFLSLPLFIFGQHSEEPALSNKESFSMVLFPDPQNYTKFDTNQPVLELMTAWTARQAEKLNIKAVLCTGDLVEQNELLIADGVNGNQTSREQWQAASRAFERLDNLLPYIIATGNHDYGYKRAENRQTNFPAYFFPERNTRWKSVLKEVFNNSFGYPTLENAAFEFDLPNWRKILVVVIEFAPRDEVLQWVKGLASSATYQQHLIVLLTHSYLAGNNQRIKQENYKVNPANYGEAIWNKLVSCSSNIELVISGHYCVIGNYEENVGYRTDKNQANRTVHQMMFNTQTDGGGWQGNGGDGWLRLLEFLPDGKTLRVRTYSPFFGYSPKTKSMAWRTDAFDQFEMIFE